MESLYNSQSDNFSRQPASFCRLSLLFSILLPYLPPPLRQPLLLFSKIYECLECFRQGSKLFSSCPDYSHASSQEQMSDIISRLSPFLDEQERSRLSQMQNMMQMMSLYQTFQEMAPFMQASAQDNSFNPFSAAFGSGQNSSAEPPHGAAPADSDTAPDSVPDTGSDSGSDFAFGAASDSFSDGNHENPAGASDFSGTGPNPEMLYSMLSPEQQELFQNLKAVMTAGKEE